MASNSRLDDEPDRLESWKEIAAFIGRDERTAMRWAARGMPVHHGPGGKHARVFASRKEISRWLAKQTDHHSVNEAEQPPGRSPRWKWIAAAGLGVSVIILAGFVFWHRTRSVAAPDVTRVTFTYNAVVAWNGSQQLWEYQFQHPLDVNAFDLHRAWPSARLEVIPESGHSALEPRTTDPLVAATEEFSGLL